MTDFQVRSKKTQSLLSPPSAAGAARLDHPAIVPIDEAGLWTDGAPFYATKHIAGAPLSDAIAAAPGLPGRLGLLPALLAVVDAIAYGHARRIIHRDLKPANVVVGTYGETYVVDWGLAKDLSARMRPTTTMRRTAARSRARRRRRRWRAHHGRRDRGHADLHVARADRRAAGRRAVGRLRARGAAVHAHRRPPPLR
jgi:serine/threonine protein kinase